jgi:hypothetical protein
MKERIGEAVAAITARHFGLDPCKRTPRNPLRGNVREFARAATRLLTDALAQGNTSGAARLGELLGVPSNLLSPLLSAAPASPGPLPDFIPYIVTREELRTAVEGSTRLMELLGRQPIHRREESIKLSERAAIYLYCEVNALGHKMASNALGIDGRDVVRSACVLIDRRRERNRRLREAMDFLVAKLDRPSGARTQLCAPQPRVKISAGEVKRVVALSFNLGVEQMNRETPTDSILVNLARQSAMVLYQRLTGVTHEAVGQAFGGYDITALRDARKRVLERSEVHPVYARWIQQTQSLLFQKADKVGESAMSTGNAT